MMPGASGSVILAWHLLWLYHSDEEILAAEKIFYNSDIDVLKLDSDNIMHTDGGSVMVCVCVCVWWWVCWWWVCVCDGGCMIVGG